MNYPIYKSEFPGFDNCDAFDAIYKIASLNGFDDESCCTESMPSMIGYFQTKNEIIGIIVWVDWKDSSNSEYEISRLSGQAKQFKIVVINEHGDTMFQYESDSVVQTILDLRYLINKYE